MGVYPRAVRQGMSFILYLNGIPEFMEGEREVAMLTKSLV